MSSSLPLPGVFSVILNEFLFSEHNQYADTCFKLSINTIRNGNIRMTSNENICHIWVNDIVRMYFFENGNTFKIMFTIAIKKFYIVLNKPFKSISLIIFSSFRNLNSTILPKTRKIFFRRTGIKHFKKISLMMLLRIRKMFQGPDNVIFWRSRPKRFWKQSLVKCQVTL